MAVGAKPSSQLWLSISIQGPAVPTNPYCPKQKHVEKKKTKATDRVRGSGGGRAREWAGPGTLPATGSMSDLQTPPDSPSPHPCTSLT